LSRAPGLSAMAARLQCRSAAAAPLVGQYGHQGSQRLGHAVHPVARRAVHGEHHARGHAEGARRPRIARRAPHPGRRRLGGSPGAVRQGWDRRGRPRRPAAGRRSQVFRLLLARADGRDRHQECRPGQGELRGTPMSRTLPLTARPSWKALKSHQEKMREVHLRTLFADDPGRGERLTTEAAGIFLDYSKNRVTDETLALPRKLAEEADLRGRIDAMFRGDKINLTENRAVLHVALRAPRGASITVDGKNVVPQVHQVLDAMSVFANRVRSGEWKGQTGKRIRNVVNIGIGGSDLGPVMAYEALRHYSDRAMSFRFVSNVDGTDMAEATRDLDPAETLFIAS